MTALLLHNLSCYLSLLKVHQHATHLIQDSRSEIGGVARGSQTDTTACKRGISDFDLTCPLLGRYGDGNINTEMLEEYTLNVSLDGDPLIWFSDDKLKEGFCFISMYYFVQF